MIDFPQTLHRMSDGQWQRCSALSGLTEQSRDRYMLDLHRTVYIDQRRLEKTRPAPNRILKAFEDLRQMSDLGKAAAELLSHPDAGFHELANWPARFAELSTTLDNLDREDQGRGRREMNHSLRLVLRSLDEYLRFITGRRITRSKNYAVVGTRICTFDFAVQFFQDADEHEEINEGAIDYAIRRDLPLNPSFSHLIDFRIPKEMTFEGSEFGYHMHADGQAA